MARGGKGEGERFIGEEEGRRNLGQAFLPHVWVIMPSGTKCEEETFLLGQRFHPGAREARGEDKGKTFRGCHDCLMIAGN